MAQRAEALVEERVMHLQEIRRRRNELLSEMFHLIQKRDNLGSVIAVEDEDNVALKLFLERFDMEKHPDSGLILNLLEDEVAIPDTPPEYSPVVPMHVLDPDPELVPELTPELGPSLPEPAQEIKADDEDEPELVPVPTPELGLELSSQPGPPAAALEPEAEAEAEAEAAVNVILDSPMSDPPTSPRAEAQEEEEEEEEREDEVVTVQAPEPLQENSAMDMDIDESSTVAATPVLPSESAIGDVSMASQHPTQEPQIIPKSPGLIVVEPIAEVTRPVKSHTPAKTPTPSPSPHFAALAPPEDSPTLSSPSPPTDLDISFVPKSPLSPPQRPDEVPKESNDVKPESLGEDTVMEQSEALATSRSEANGAPLSGSHGGQQSMNILAPSQLQTYLIFGGEDQRHPAYTIPLPRPQPMEDYSIADGQSATDFVQNPVRHPTFGPEPPLLPMEFTRKRSSKKKKDKEKESKKEEWQPMTNPLHPKLSRSSKCLSTRDWSVGITELRYMRAFERIEKLKDGAWSFRQPKKQRGVGSSVKTHWDYLIDEMRWMRTDFREERRWKLALAYTLSRAVVEWHEAGSLEERVNRGIVVRWTPPPPEDAEMADGEGDRPDGPFRESQEADENGADSRETATPLDGYATDDESDEEQDKETQEAADGLTPGGALQDALEQLEQDQATVNQPNATGVSLRPKVEEIEDLTALGETPAARAENAMNVDVKKDITEQSGVPDVDASKTDPLEAHPGLKSTSKDPVLGAAGKEVSDKKSTKSKANQYAPLREAIIYSDFDKLFIDPDDLDIIKGMSELTTTEDPFAPSSGGPPVPHDLATIFPDLVPFTMLDVAPPPVHEVRKKGDKKSDKDDPNKRHDETTYFKVTSASKFMHIKPALLGTLQPAKHYEDGHWDRIEDTPVFLDIDVVHPREEHLCALFETSTPRPHIIPQPTPLRDPRKRNADHGEGTVWTPAEDILLKQAVDRYPTNWALAADAFNSSRVTISTDKRTTWECAERWTQLAKETRASSSRGDGADEGAGHKRSLTQTSGLATAGSSSATGEPRKRRRHASMHDAVRKSTKKREALQKSSAAPRVKPAAVHDTHGQFTKLPRLTPAELSRMKAEKEARDQQDLALRQRPNMNRQQLVREQQQRAQGLPPNAHPPQNPQTPMHPQANGVARAAPGQSPMVPSIRSQVGISQQQQQQRIAAALASANTRMSPPQLSAQQLQVAHMRAMAAAQGQAQQQQQQVPGQPSQQAQVSAQPQMPAQMPPPSNASAALTAAAPALSSSPPLPVASPPNVQRPPSVPGQPVQGAPVNPMVHANMTPFYPHNMHVRGAPAMQAMQGLHSVEQIQAFLRLQQQQQQYAAHAQQQQQTGPNGSFPHA
ncbi:uncharacterized protein BXZ73DRAFT_86175 [Epithele typhae]|uniref:uncharacterized protein n=1 Tax=Epithele typhae TaxID=378194 RepID=UPI002007A387|nr:uncharacterized protein BXZ73DRAFT_86175 [Epithele typhae]KAH9945945.1 hypothetical protein BXZ73DRAFT_86175 [Epithele typhae]